jgi:hypothetical protein
LHLPTHFGGHHGSPAHIYEVWTSAAVLVGFQLISFAWRLSRELELMKRQPKEKNWFPPANYLNLLSMLVLIVAVFVLPTPNPIGDERARAGLQLSLILLAGYPFAIAGHYRLFRIAKPKPRPYCTLQEALFVFVTMAGASWFMISAHFFSGRRLLNWLLPVVFLWFVFGPAVSEFAQSKQRGRIRWLAMPFALPALLGKKLLKLLASDEEN